MKGPTSAQRLAELQARHIALLDVVNAILLAGVSGAGFVGLLWWVVG